MEVITEAPVQNGSEPATSLPHFSPFSSQLPSHQAILSLFVLGLDVDYHLRGCLQTACALALV